MNALEIVPGRFIGPSHPCFIIAEAGVNHNGSYELACQLVDAAHAAGADAVKFQTWITEALVAPDARLADYQQRNDSEAESQFSMLKKLELSQEVFTRIKAYCEQKGIVFLSTPDEEASSDFLEALGMGCFKIGSAELDNLRYLRHVARKGRPMIVSTGMGTLEEAKAAVDAIRGEGLMDVILLQCVSEYPADPKDCNLRAMATLAEGCECLVGFSDHTMHAAVGIAAVALGACVIEKHITTDRLLPGPDHVCSMPPGEFRDYVAAIREAESALGTGEKVPVQAEAATREVVRKKIVAARDLSPGEVLCADDFLFLRAEGGIPPGEISQIIGKRLTMPLRKHAPLHWEQVD